MPKKKPGKKKISNKKRAAKLVKKYTIAKGFTIPQKDAQVIGARLEILTAQNHGELTPEIVLDDARSTKSPLHKHFEWDDYKAAEKYRMDRARYIIRSVVLEARIEGRREPVRGFLHVKSVESRNQSGKPRGVFVTHAKAMKTPDYVGQLILEACEKIEELERILKLLGQNLKK